MIKALKALNLIMFILCAIVCAVNIKAGHIGSGAFVGSCGIVNLLFAVRGGDNMTDAISRQQAIDALRDYLAGKRCPDDGTLTCRLIENEVINKLPLIQLRTGKWIDTGSNEEWYAREYKCSECGDTMLGDANFCPNCGAKMEEKT